MMFFSLNNHKFSDYVYDIYPVELEIKETTDDQYHSSFLDLLLEIDKDRRLRVKIYDKRDDFNFDIVNFPFLCGNIPQSPSYGVYISQLIRYARASTLYDDFLLRSCRLKLNRIDEKNTYMLKRILFTVDSCLYIFDSTYIECFMNKIITLGSFSKMIVRMCVVTKPSTRWTQ